MIMRLGLAVLITMVITYVVTSLTHFSFGVDIVLAILIGLTCGTIAGLTDDSY